MKNLAFKFYSVLKNEDAMPYIGNNLLVVADGLGGAGSTVHSIDRLRHQNLQSEIMRNVFGDIPHVSPELMQYIETLIAPMIDEMDDTSALWASRIVIARCVYALTEGEFKTAELDDEKVRADLAEFIAKGLHSAVETFNLEKGKYDNQFLLPTTLAFIRYIVGEDSVIADTVWAGDSRCYALTPLGLKLLSVDDEDASGSITNFFYADNQKIHLNYLRHEIQKPCILMTVSDGIFDPFEPHDHLGVEYCLLSAMADSDSEQELADKLQSSFDSVHGDDATMAFVAFGFADFADMKKAFEQRYAKILSIRQKQAEMHSALEVMNLSEEDAAHYVVARTADRYDYIISTLIDAIEQGRDDIAVTAGIRSVVEAVRKATKEKAEKAKKERREQALRELGNYVLSHPEDMTSQLATIIFSDQLLQERVVAEFKRTAEDFVLQESKIAELESQCKNWLKDKEELHQKLQARMNKYRKSFDELWFAQDRQSLVQRKEIAQILSWWYFIDNALKANQILQETGIKDHFPDKEFAEERALALDVKARLDKYRSWQHKKKELEKTYGAKKNNYTQAWNKLFSRLKKDEHLIYSIFRPEIIVRYGLAVPAGSFAAEKVECDRDSLMRALKAEKTAIVSGIVQALAIGYDQASAIDSQYNTTKLNLFRTYYKLQKNPRNEIKEFEEELRKLEAEYTSLVPHAEF